VANSADEDARASAGDVGEDDAYFFHRQPALWENVGAVAAEVMLTQYSCEGA
jgi:hypothetical protein